MTTAALLLVLGSAVIHATWNLLTKRLGGGAPAVWCFATVGFLVYAPLVAIVILLQRPALDGERWLFLAGSGVLQVVFFVLRRPPCPARRQTLVHPPARGRSPVLAMALAIGLLGERPSPLAIAGGGLVAVGVFSLAFTGHRPGATLFGEGAVYGIVLGVFIGTYTVWDGYAVSRLGIPPVLQSWSSEVARVVFLAPVAARHRCEVRSLWRGHWREVVAIGVLSPLSYLIVLFALTLSPISYIAPAREVSILFGAILGATLLHEGHHRQRLIGAAVIVLGIGALAVG
jgi:drug/metabolite transporter (DMT)-like permease